jgi:hypothetical protein
MVIKDNSSLHLNCFLLPAKIEFCDPHFISHHEKTYDLWHNVIHHALSEEKNIQAANNLSSEHFQENDEVVTLFYDDQPIGLFMFRWINTFFKINRNLHALEKRFPKTLLDTLIDNKQFQVMLMGHLAIDPLWRKSNTHLGIADMLMYFAVSRFLESNADVLLTTTRNNRRTNELCYRQGGKKAADNGKVFGVESDIVLFQRGDVSPLENTALANTAAQLWLSKKIGWAEKIPLQFLKNKVNL